MTPEQIIADLQEQARKRKQAPECLNASEFITPQGAADDMERRNNLAKATEDLILVIAAGALGWLAGMAIVVVMAGGV